MAGRDLLQFTYDMAHSNDEPVEDKDSPTAADNVEADGVVAELPSMDAVCVVTKDEVVNKSVSNVGRETESPGARHRGGLDADKLEGQEGLRRLSKNSRVA